MIYRERNLIEAGRLQLSAMSLGEVLHIWNRQAAGREALN